jgi:AcrR family transcriptional regulator
MVQAETSLAAAPVAPPAPTPAVPLKAAPKPPRRARATRSNAQVHGDETRAKIISACVETLNVEGITGTSARAIARAGDFNQALIFYHFGSVEGLLITASAFEGQQRALRYKEAFETVTTLQELISVARQVHHQEQSEGSVNVLTQMLAGAASAPELQEGILEATRPWMVLVEDAVGRVLAGSSLVSLVPTTDIAFAISSLFLGIELLTGLDPSGDKATALFDSIEKISGVLQLLISSTK